MFTIRVYKIGDKAPCCVAPTTVETLAEAEIIAAEVACKEFGITNVEIVYIEELDYYVYSPDIRLGRLTIQPIYEKVRTKE